MNTVRLEILRECDETPYLAAELSGSRAARRPRLWPTKDSTSRPALAPSDLLWSSQRPFMTRRRRKPSVQARAVIDMAGILPPPWKPYAFRRLFRFDSALAHVCLQEERLMPWVKAENWCRAPRFSGLWTKESPKGGALWALLLAHQHLSG